MTEKVFFDTNIIIYLFDKSETKKHSIAKDLINENFNESIFYISSQVINEFINVSTSKIQKPISFAKQKSILSLLENFFIINPVFFITSFTAVDLKLKYNFSFWDSLIISSALEKDCIKLFSEDFQHKQKIENKLEIINPFI